MQRISIDPITRLEGHGKIDIFLDDQGEVANAYFQIPELRGFEVFCVGRPAEDMPNLTDRICGVCPEAHHMAAHQGPRRAVARRPASGGEETARADLQHLLRHRPHHPLLRPGRPGLHRRARCPGGRAQHPGRDPEGGHGRGRQGAQDAPRRPRPDPDDRPPGACSPTGGCLAASAGASTRSSARRSRSSGATPSSSPCSRCRPSATSSWATRPTST